MKTRTKYVHEGEYVAEVQVELIEDETEWSPYLSLNDAKMLDEVKAALKSGDLQTASRLASVYKLVPVS